jgi:hypothetical protein
MVCRVEGHELGQIPQDVDEPREDISDPSGGAPSLSSLRKEDERRMQTIPDIADRNQDEVIIEGGYSIMDDLGSRQLKTSTVRDSI